MLKATLSFRLIAPLIALVALGAALMPSQPALARNHCMRVHAVMAGLNGDSHIQYVELRAFFPVQDLLAGKSISFYDGSGTAKAVFTFPTNVSNAAIGDSVLIGTHEFNTVSDGADADFEFSAANTAASNGGDPLHPVQGPSGKVAYFVGSQNCPMPQDGPAVVDSLAYGDFTGTVDFGTAAEALPIPSDNRALRLKGLVGEDPTQPGEPTDNSVEYSLQPVSDTSYTVLPTDLATDLNTPRNNSRVVARLPLPGKATGGGQIDPVTGEPAVNLMTGEPLEPATMLMHPGSGSAGSSASGQAKFSFVVEYRSGDSAPRGNLRYVDESAGMDLKASSLSLLAIGDGPCGTGKHARFSGKAVLTGSAAQDFVVDVDDCGSPGSSDTFRISLPGQSYEASGTLIGGNINIHG